MNKWSKANTKKNLHTLNRTLMPPIFLHGDAYVSSHSNSNSTRAFSSRSSGGPWLIVGWWKWLCLYYLNKHFICWCTKPTQNRLTWTQHTHSRRFYEKSKRRKHKVVSVDIPCLSVLGRSQNANLHMLANSKCSGSFSLGHLLSALPPFSCSVEAGASHNDTDLLSTKFKGQCYDCTSIHPRLTQVPEHESLYVCIFTSPTWNNRK